MSRNLYAAAVIGVVALVTFLTRVIPFLFFGGKRTAPGPVRYLGGILPAAIMAMLVVYLMRNVQVLAYPYGLPELIASVCVVALHCWKRNNLISILGGTGVYMALIQLVFV